MSTEYDDIINLPHHVSSRRRHMTLEERAAQFAPFAALTGFEAAISETGRPTEKWIERTESQQDLLDRKQQAILELENGHPLIAVTHFVPDEKKSGGTYEENTGFLKDLDPSTHLLILTDGRRIPMHNIIDIVNLSDQQLSSEITASDPVWD